MRTRLINMVRPVMSPMALGVHRLQLELRPQVRTRLPAFLGSTLRGALGHGLRARHPQVFEQVFEGRDSGVPGFVLRPPELRFAPWTPRDVLRFEVVLLGEAAQTVSAWVDAAQFAARNGLGAQRTRFELTAIETTGETSRSASFGSVWVHGPQVLSLARRVDLWLMTPLSLRVGGRVLERVDAPRLMRSAVARADRVMRAWGREGLPEVEALMALAGTVRGRGETEFVRWARYSNRQARKVPLGGVLGRVRLEGAALARLAPVLAIGEQINFGKQTALGLGRAVVEAL